jgi:hypothetical protein
VASVISCLKINIERLRMIRTLICIEPDDKAWLERTARRERIPMTRLVGHAIKRLREESESSPSRFHLLLRETSGMQKFGDALAYQRRLRREWDRRK